MGVERPGSGQRADGAGREEEEAAGAAWKGRVREEHDRVLAEFAAEYAPAFADAEKAGGGGWKAGDGAVRQRDVCAVSEQEQIDARGA